MTDIQYGIKFTATGGKQVAGEIKATATAFDGMSEAAKNATSQAQQLNTAQATLSQNSDSLRKSVAAQDASWASVRKSIQLTVAEQENSSTSVSKLLDKYDQQGAKLRKLKSDFDTLNKAAVNGAVGTKDDGRLDLVYSKLQQEMSAAGDAATGFGAASSAAMDKHFTAADKGAFATVGARRELMVLGHEAMTGNFSRIPGSMMVLAERVDFTAASLLGLGGAVLGTAAAAGVAVLAYSQGAAEMKSMDSAIAQTGDYAGVTRGQMRELAQGIADTGTVTIGTAKDIVTELVKSGQIGGEAMKHVTGIAGQYAQVTGEDAKQVGASLLKTFTDPVKGAEELNKQWHLLSEAEMEHIRTLAESGNEQQAQIELADKMKGRLDEMTQNLGIVSGAWGSLGNAASSAWDAIEGIGRKTTSEEALNAAKTALLQRQSSLSFGDAFGLTDRTAALAALQREVDLRQSIVADDQQSAKARGDAAKASQAEAEAMKLAGQYSKQAQVDAINAQIAKLQGLGQADANGAVSDAYTPEAARQQHAAINALLKDRENIYRSMGTESRQAQQAQIDGALKLQEVNLTYAQTSSDAQLKLGEITQAEHEKTKVYLELQKNTLQQNAVLQQESVKGLTTQEKQRLDNQLQVLQATRAEIELRGQTTSLVDEKKSYDDVIKSINNTGAAELSRLQSAIDAQKLHNAEIGKTAVQRELEKQAIDQATIAQMKYNAALLQYSLDAAAMDDEGRKIYQTLLDNLNAEIGARKQLADLLNKGAVAQAAADETKKQAEDWKALWSTVESTGKSVFINLLSNGRSAFQSIGAAIKSSVIDLLYQITVKQWLISIGTTISGTASANSVAGSLGGGSSASSAGGWLQAGQAIWQGMSGGFTEAFVQYQAQVGALMYQAGAQQAGMAVMTDAATVGANGSYAGVGVTAAQGMAGIAVGSMVAGDKQLAGMDGTTWAAIGAVVGSIFPVVGTFFGAVIGGAIDAAFGQGPKNYAAQTLSGTFSQKGFTGTNAQYWSQDGGWFSSGSQGIDRTPLNSAQQTAINSMMVGTAGVFAQLLSVSGQANRSLAAWTFTINQSVNTQAQQTQLMTDLANSMGKVLAPELVAVQKQGESLADTAVRMSDEFVMTNTIAIMAGKDISTAFGSIGLASAQMRDNLVQLLGGVQPASTAMQAYYTNFTTTAQQQANGWRQVDASMAALGITTIPRTRSEFVALVNAQDLSTKSGQTMYAALIGLAPAFAAVTTDAQTMATGMQTLSQALHQAIGSTMQQMTVAQAQAQVSAALAIAQAGGPLPTAQSLQGALSVLTNQSQFGSSLAYQRATSSISALTAVTDKRLSAITGPTSSTIPMFADGGAHSGGWRIVGEQGPELAYTGPEQIVSNSGMQNLIDLSGLIAELRALRDDVNAGLYPIARDSLLMRKLEERWDVDGMPAVRVP